MVVSGHKTHAKFDMERAFTVLMKNLSRFKTSKIKKFVFKNNKNN